MSLAEKIAKLMAQMEITTNELSLNANIERSTLTRILNGSTVTPRIETIHSLAKYFKVDVKELIENDTYTYRNNNFQDNRSQTNIKDMLTNLMYKTGTLSITALNKHTGIPFSVLSDILNGKTEKPSMKTLHSLSKHFKISVSQLMGLDPIENLAVEQSGSKIPVIPFQELDQFLSGDSSPICNYYNCTKILTGNNSFSLLISNNKFDSEFQNGNILIIDSGQTPTNRDFIVCKINKITSVYEFKKSGDNISLREAGTKKINRINNVKDLFIFGVLVQQIINFK